jgi:hypothetical protein
MQKSLAILTILFSLFSTAVHAEGEKDKLKLCDLSSDEVIAVLQSDECKATVSSFPQSISNARAECRMLRVCKRTIRHEKRECKGGCKDAVKSCKDDCNGLTRDAKNQCKSQCKDAKDVCKFACKQTKSEGIAGCEEQYLTPSCKDARSDIWESIPNTGSCLARIVEACKKNEAIQE